MVSTRLVALVLLLFTSAAVTGCITRDEFGRYRVSERGDLEYPVYRYTFDNGNVVVQVIEYGATITSIRVPDSKGHLEDVVLGYDTLEGYFSNDNPYFGATVGRVANRVANGQFTLDGVTYNLFKNNGNHSLHGGLHGFDKKLWSSRMEEDRVVMEYSSGDCEEGYPGQLNVTVTYSLTQDNTLVIQYKAFTSRRTPINLTNHAYFNLAGHSAGPSALYKHTVYIRANQITETTEEFIPTGTFWFLNIGDVIAFTVQGRLKDVGYTEFDLRAPTNLGEAIQRTSINGFDNNFVLPQDRSGLIMAVVEDPDSGRRVEVETSQPGIQFYTSNSISAIRGKESSTYTRHAAFCLEAQNFPDAVNHPLQFPNSVFGPLDGYHQVTKYKFTTFSRQS